MKSKAITAAFAFVLSLAQTAAAADKIKVVTSLPGLAALAREVAGDLAEVDSLAAPNQDPHFVDGRPSFISKLNRADMLVHIGLELEVGWLPPLVVNSRNGKIQAGQPGDLDASRSAGPLLGIPTPPVDRRMGDVHPGGNPHYLLSPRYGLRVARTIAGRLAEIDQGHAAQYQANFDRFQQEMDVRIAGWEKQMAPYRGKSVVAYHASTIYLTDWLGLKEAGFFEATPGVSPSPSYLAHLIGTMKAKEVKVVIAEPWYDLKTVQIVSGKAGASVAILPGDVGSSNTKTYADMIDRTVQVMTGAFAGNPAPSAGN